MEGFVEDLIDEVLKSTETEPSVAEVVFDTINDVVNQEDDEENETSTYDVADIENELDDLVDKVDEKTENDKNVKAEDVPKSEEKDMESVSNDKNSGSSVTRIEIGQPGDKPKTAIVQKTEMDSKLEEQEIKVRVDSDDEKSDKKDQKEQKGKNISVITINGQAPANTGNSVLVNGHVTGVKDTSGNEIMINSISNQKNDPNVPQTDLDSYDVEENHEDKSDTESVNTEDSIDKVEPRKPVHKSQGHIRNRSVSKLDCELMISLMLFYLAGIHAFKLEFENYCICTNFAVYLIFFLFLWHI